MWRYIFSKWNRFKSNMDQLASPIESGNRKSFKQIVDEQMRAWEDDVKQTGKLDFWGAFKWYDTKSPTQQQQSSEIEFNQGASVAFMITKKMSMELKELGYRQTAIDKLSPKEANFILENKIKFKPKLPDHLKSKLENKGNEQISPIILAGVTNDQQSTTENGSSPTATTSELPPVPLEFESPTNQSISNNVVFEEDKKISESSTEQLSMSNEKEDVIEVEEKPRYYGQKKSFYMDLDKNRAQMYETEKQQQQQQQQKEEEKNASQNNDVQVSSVSSSPSSVQVSVSKSENTGKQK
eukprot:TRINITY_DN281_c5_g1_i3.p1 TRINITY_DN281_c5_g1~~TRINITY_DN281_c5_g1_i3.p1  ORF type:complete len:296 (+),score=95.14 TRINITY_DN281_c5_g1_i3:3-890(+)